MGSAFKKTDNLYQNIFESASDGIIISDLEEGKILAANPIVAEMHGYDQKVFCGLTLQSFIHKKSLPLFTEFSRTIRQGNSFERTAKHIRQDGSQFWIEWRAVRIKFHNQDCALALVRDISKRVQREEKLKQRMRERVQEQSILQRISYALSSTLELQPQLILDQLKILINYSHASLHTLQDSTLITLSINGIDHLEEPLPYRIRLNGKKTLETLFNEHQPIWIANLASDDPDAVFLRSLLENGSAILLKGMKSWMWVPLAVKKRIVGGIGIAHEKHNFFTHHHAELAMTIANQAAITLVNAELYKNAQAYAAYHERQRIAQNLHDAVNQSLFSAGLIAEVLPRLWEREPQEARRSLEDLRRLTRGAMAEMRALLAEIRPDTLIDTELEDLLLLLGNAFSGRTNIPVDVTVKGERDLPSKTKVTLYRICQEVFNNIAKHAGASLAEIFLNLTPKGLELRISDNGCGFDPSKPTISGHYGLSMIDERAAEIGARLTIISQPGEGTEINICWNEKEGK
jgi:PAS domain S-box-containing protein